MTTTDQSCLHTLEPGRGRIEVLMHRRIDGRIAVNLSVRDVGGEASVSLSPAQARAAASVLIVAAEQAEARIARGTGQAA